MEEPVKPALFRATSELGFFKIDSIADCFSAHSCQKELHSNTREGGGGGAVSATQKQTVIMTLWGQCVFWRSHFLPLGTRLRTWIRILNCKEMFVTSLIDSLKKKKHPFSGHGASLSALHNTLYTNLRENKSHFGAEALCGSPDRVLWMAVMNFECFTKRTHEQMVLLAEVPPNTHWHTGNEINLFCYCKKRKEKKSPIGWI